LWVRNIPVNNTIEYMKDHIFELWLKVWCIQLWVLACCRLTVIGEDKQSWHGTNGTSGIWLKKIGEGALSYFFSPDPTRPSHAFTINPTDREPGTSYLASNPWFRSEVMALISQLLRLCPQLWWSIITS